MLIGLPVIQFRGNRAGTFKSASRYALCWFEITCMITSWILHHLVLLPLLLILIVTLLLLYVSCKSWFWFVRSLEPMIYHLLNKLILSENCSKLNEWMSWISLLMLTCLLHSLYEVACCKKAVIACLTMLVQNIKKKKKIRFSLIFVITGI